MKKKHIVSLLFFLVCGFVAVTMAQNFSDTKNSEEVIGGDKVIISIKDQLGSIIDKVSDQVQENVSKEEVEKVVTEKVIVPVEKVIYQNTVEKISEVIDNTIINPVEEATDDIKKDIISKLLSLFTPEEIREVFNSEFDTDICKP